MRTLEDILLDVGGAGRFQLLAIFALFSPKLFMAWSMLEMSFANLVPQWCCLPDNMTQPAHFYCSQDDDQASFAKECFTNTSSCTHRVFQPGVSTVVSQWDLVCERKWMSPLTTSIQMAGVLVGALVAGQMVDIFGRKTILFSNSALCLVSNLVAGASVSLEMFAAVRFVIGLSIGGYLAVSVLYYMEFLSPSKRKLIIIIPAWEMGTSLLALGAWVSKDWKWVHWLGGIGMAPCLLGYFFMPESMRWLATRGKIEEAQKVVEQIAHWNRRPVPADTLDVIKATAKEERESTKTKEYKTYTYIDLYKGRRLCVISSVLQFSWLALSMCTYGISFGAASLGFSVYLNIFFMAFISFPFLITLHFVIDRTGRKKAAFSLFMSACVCGFGALAALLLVPDTQRSMRDVVINVCNLVSRGMQSAAWSSVSMLCNESYPTVIRGLASGAVNTAARIGGILAPFVLNIEDTPDIAFAVMGSVLFLSACLIYFLDETAGKAMPDTSKAIAHNSGEAPRSMEEIPIPAIHKEVPVSASQS